MKVSTIKYWKIYIAALTTAMTLTAGITPASAASLLGQLHNTGAGLNPGTIDHNWGFTQGSPSVVNIYTVNPNPAWIANTSTSRWLSPAAITSNWQPDAYAAMTYLGRQSINLSGYMRKTLAISGRVATDDGGQGIYLNGTLVSHPASGFDHWANFSIVGSANTNVGSNNIDFKLTNVTGVTGLRVEFTSAMATPIPTANALLSLGNITIYEGEQVNLPYTLAATSSNGSYPYNLGTISSLTFSTSGTVGPSSASYSNVVVNGATKSLTPSFKWADDGNYSITSSGVTSQYLASDSIYTATSGLGGGYSVTVLNVAPTIQSITGDLTANLNQVFNFAALAADPGVNDVLIYNWDLDNDGNYDNLAASGGSTSFSILGQHQIGLRVSDGDGGYGYDSFTVTIVPEPAQTSLVIGLLTLALWTRCRRRA